MESTKNIKFRISKTTRDLIKNDLLREHEHAYERVGFILTRKHEIKNETLILVYDYIPVKDEYYIEDDDVGARINSTAIKNALEIANKQNCGVFHVHIHKHDGKPIESKSDIVGIPPMIESLSNINNEYFGYLILSNDSALCKVKNLSNNDFTQANTYIEVGYPMKVIHSKEDLNFEIPERQKRQTFLGENAQTLMQDIKIAIIGYGGGGSHFGLQLAHIGFEKLTIFDDDQIEESNINRLVGAQFEDIENSTYKVEIAKRTIGNILPSSSVETIKNRWQESPEILQSCDVVIGCIDSYLEREQLEAECRRYLIPLIDIGMDIHKIEDFYSISGQVILSTPGRPCMRTMNYITDEKLAKEASKYGNIGGNPQVIWSNGVLASTGISTLMNLLFNWTKKEDKDVYLSYDGNSGIIMENPRLEHISKDSAYYPIDQVGPIQLIEI